MGSAGAAGQEDVMDSFGSILDLEESPYKDKEVPAFFQDLNLDQIIERIRLDWGYHISSFYYYLPADAKCSDYRREVFADVKREGVFDALYEFTEKMKERREAFFKKEEVESQFQKAAWHVWEVDCYCDAFGRLGDALDTLALRSGGMLGFKGFLQAYLSRKDFGEMREAARRLRGQMEGLRLVLVYENDRITVSPGEVSGAYETFLDRRFPGQDKRMKSPFEAALELTELELELLGAYKKQNPALFGEIKRFYDRYREYAEDTLIRFSSEICYYLAYYRFERRMRECGFAFAEPVTAEERGSMSVEGLYDLALASANRGRREEIVSNDVRMGPEEGFFVVTGPNQGGKTTFARSLGQLAYFTRMGLDVPASSACVYPFQEIWTHFSVEESVETGRGKLQDELERLLPMMADSGAAGNAFVVLNELFTTAANYDACIMGKKVLEHFLERGYRGVYVTHLKELCQVHPRVVSLCARLDDRGNPTYKIERGMAAESASAIHLVEKHGLTYGRLKERLGRF